MSLLDFAGVYAAALTPQKEDFSPDLDAIPSLLSFYAQRGCHGTLLLGTTGEGPSFAPEERTAIFRAATKVRQDFPDFRLMAGTGTPSLEETVSLTREAFNLGFNAVVVLPPYYFRNVSDEGLFAWFKKIIEQAMPSDGAMFGYHIPAVSGVGLSFELLSKLKDSYPKQFYGVKDSTGDPKHAEQLGKFFGHDLTVLTGNDRLLSFAMQNQAAGCITAMANLYSPSLRKVWDAYQNGGEDPETQGQLNAWRDVMDNYQPYATVLKQLMHRMYEFPKWSVRPPLLPLPNEIGQKAFAELDSATKISR